MTLAGISTKRATWRLAYEILRGQEKGLEEQQNKMEYLREL
jgi:hypothetical protein